MFETIGMLRQGGLIMLPLALCSLTAVTIILERLYALRRSAVFEGRVLHIMQQYAGETTADAALAACRQTPGPLARVIEEVIRTRHIEHAQAVEAVHATGRIQVASLERGLTLLEIIAGVSPLLGLLGTVLGMVTVFNAITAQGIGDPQVLSDGISKALVTTVAGLIIAIPSLAFHSWLSRRVDDYAMEMQNAAMRFVFKVRALPKRSE